MILRFCC